MGNEDEPLLLEEERTLRNYGIKWDEDDEISDLEFDESENVPYPKSVFFIVTSEFCERFSFYGMRAILTLYLHNVLFYTEDESTIIFHCFVFLCYFTPLFGAMVADSYLGKFMTIFVLSIVYAFGSLTLSIGSITPAKLPQIPFTFIGLILIGIGTGGIKPCVSAFGGDQFKVPAQEKQLVTFFSIFYFAINSGSLISTFVTPIFREEECFGDGTCYPLAFGVPSILMIISFVIFLFGKPLYNIKKPNGNVIVQIWKCSAHALSERRKAKSANLSLDDKHHWLEYAKDKYDFELIRDIKQLFKILILFIPLPIFWALFDQQGSKWTLQATKLNGLVQIGNYSFTVKPDQVQLLNSLFVLLFIPLFDFVLYPLFAKCNLLKSPLERMSIGGIFVAISFISAGILELKLEDDAIKIPQTNEMSVGFINELNCTVSISYYNGNENLVKNVPSFHYESLGIFNTKYGPNIKIGQLNETGNECGFKEEQVQIKFYNDKFLIARLKKSANGLLILPEVFPSKDLIKSSDGKAKLRLIYDGNSTNVEFSMIKKGGTVPTYHGLKYLIDNAFEFSPDIYLIKIGSIDPVQIDLKTGGIYLIIQPNSTKSEFFKDAHSFVIAAPNEIHIAFQVPQYTLITIGEILFSVTGYSFSYDQAPTGMKSVIQSAWLLTNAVGNLLVVIITKLDLFPLQSILYFVFSILMFLATASFILLARRFRYYLK